MAVETKKTSGKMEAVIAFVWGDGARPPVYRTHIVRDRHSGKLVEVPLTEDSSEALSARAMDTQLSAIDGSSALSKFLVHGRLGSR